MEDLPAPFAEPDQERPVETKAGADALDVGRGRLVAGDHRGRIAGRDVEEAEYEECHDRHHRDGREDTADDVGQHSLMLADFMPGSVAPYAVARIERPLRGGAQPRTL